MTDAQTSVDEEPKIKTWIILLVFFGIAGVVFGALWYDGRVETYTHNGFEFTKADCAMRENCWETYVETNVGVRQLLFVYGPREVQDIPVDVQAVQRVLSLRATPEKPSGRLIIAFDRDVPGEVGVAAANIARITGDRVFQIATVGAVYGTNQSSLGEEFSRPVRCDVSSEDLVVLYLTQGATNAVTVTDNGCVLLIAQDTTDVLRVADAFSLRLLGIL